MATPEDPNKALLTASRTVEAAQPGYGLLKSQYAEVYHGQVIDGYVLTVVNGVVTSIDAEV